MPELYNNEFTASAGLEYGDIFHIQRHPGIWTDFKVRNINMFGVAVKTKRMTYNIQDLLAADQTFDVSPGVGNIYLPIKPYAIYTPGTVNDNFEVELLGQLGYESGGDKGACCKFIFNTTIQGAPLCSYFQAHGIVASFLWDFALGVGGAGTTSNGTITVWSAYSIVTLP